MTTMGRFGGGACAVALAWVLLARCSCWSALMLSWIIFPSLRWGNVTDVLVGLCMGYLVFAYLILSRFYSIYGSFRVVPVGIRRRVGRSFVLVLLALEGLLVSVILCFV